MLDPTIAQIAQSYAGRAICVKVNTDDCPNLATKFGIRSIPTLIIFSDGEKKETIVGAVPLRSLTDALDKFLAWFPCAPAVDLNGSFQLFAIIPLYKHFSIPEFSFV